ncbi:MAG: FtsX-like permease family protein, partial [Cyclobacteriaceae bacterium]
DTQSALGKIETTLARFNPTYPFEYEFVDVAYDEKFKSIGLIQKLAGIFTILAVAITCLGLFGLISYTAEQRTREIGIRKVLGASANHLIVLITKDFTVLVLIAFIIAGPLSWWLLDDYLEKYPIRVSIAWWLIPLTSLVVLLITLVIVVTRANRATKIDPVETLKSE